MNDFLKEFVRESNRIEGIIRDPTIDEIKAHGEFIHLPRVTVKDLENFVRVVAPGHVLRNQTGLDVEVGNHYPPLGGKYVKDELENQLRNLHSTAPHFVHLKYEWLHPFTDGNGRSGRVLWLWCMDKRNLLDIALRRGFLHNFYYQTLEAYDDLRALEDEK